MPKWFSLFCKRIGCIGKGEKQSQKAKAEHRFPAQAILATSDFAKKHNERML